MPGEQVLEQREVEVILGLRCLGDGVLRDQLQGDRHVPEREVEVDHAHVVAGLGEGDAEVDGHRGLADAALGGEDHEHLALPLALGGAWGRGSPPRWCAARVTAVPSAAWSSAATTAPMPACIGLGVDLGLELVPDQDDRRAGVPGPDALGESRCRVMSRVGPITSAYSPRPVSQPSTSSGRATTCAPPGSAEREHTCGGGVGVDEDRHAGSFWTESRQLEEVWLLAPCDGATWDSSLSRPNASSPTFWPRRDLLRLLL